MKILLIGKTGQLGADIARNNKHHELTAPDRSVLDIRSRESIDAALDDHRPDVVINTAALEDVPLCEADPASAFAVNCTAARDLAGASNRFGALFVGFSTDYVFDGEKKAPYLEDDKPSPVQMYGISRLAGEFAALSAAPLNTILVRTCGLYGRTRGRSKGGNFIDKRIEEARSQEPLEMGGDQIVSPTYTNDLSKALLQLLDHPLRAPGVYHLVNEGKCSWYEFTLAIYEIMGLTAVIKPVDRSGKSGDISRPLYSALANTKARSLGITLPPWRNALERYLLDNYELHKW
jgi:dTDP-4-dehydrorhamnose reductase